MNSLNASTPGNISTLAEKGAGCYRSLAWTPSGLAVRDQVQHSLLVLPFRPARPAALRESPPTPASITQVSALHQRAKNPISLLAAAVPTLPAVPLAEVTPVAVQAQVLLTPSVAWGLFLGETAGTGRYRKLPNPATSISPPKVKS